MNGRTNAVHTIVPMQRRKMLSLRTFFFVVGVLAATVSTQTETEKSISATLSFAQTTSTPSPSPVGASSAAQTFTVQVGNGDHKFKPDVIQAAVGDVSSSPSDICFKVFC